MEGAGFGGLSHAEFLLSSGHRSSCEDVDTKTSVETDLKWEQRRCGATVQGEQVQPPRPRAKGLVET